MRKPIRMSSVAIRKSPRIVDSGQSYNHGTENTFRESVLWRPKATTYPIIRRHGVATAQWLKMFAQRPDTRRDLLKVLYIDSRR